MHDQSIRGIRRRASALRWRVPNPMPRVREYHSHRPRHRAQRRHRRHHCRLLLFPERRVEARDGVCVQQRYRREHRQRQDRVHKVPQPDPVLRQVHGGAGIRVREGPQATDGG